MGLFGMAFGLGFTVGPLLGGIIAGSNYSNETLSLVILIAIGINIVNLLYVLFFVNVVIESGVTNSLPLLVRIVFTSTLFFFKSLMRSRAL